MKITSDIHIHTSLSSCADREATFMGYVEAAKSTGLKTLGFADHLWDSAVPGASRWYEPQNVEHVLKLKDELPASREVDGIKLLFGCETEFAYGGKLCLAEENFEHFDYVIVPHSHTHMALVAPKELIPDERSHAELIMKSFMQLVTHPLIGRVASVAHLLVAGTSHPRYNAVQSYIPNSYLYEAFSAAKEAGVAIEMNGSCLIYLPSEEIPHSEYVRIFSIAKECGCRFTYGSDSHNTTDNRKLYEVERFFDLCGITDADMLTDEEILARNRK